VLELAILGLLQESPMHGYELRKQLATKLGAIRAAISFGTLYPTLRRLYAEGWITEGTGTETATQAEVPPLATRRSRVVYKITAEGKERFQELLAEAGPETYDDTGFGVHFAFFSRTDQDTRLRILEGRRRRIEERREGLRNVLARAAERLDAYTLELQRHGLEACEREVRWLEELIATERSGGQPGQPSTGRPAQPEPPGRPDQPETPGRADRAGPDEPDGPSGAVPGGGTDRQSTSDRPKQANRHGRPGRAIE
jgi:DNA-binding PadR family transcriptional regulator